MCHDLWLLSHMGNQAYTYTCFTELGAHTHRDAYAYCTSLTVTLRDTLECAFC